jgi:hypothetical protein
MRTFLCCWLLFSSVSIAQVPTCINITQPVRNIPKISLHQKNSLPLNRPAVRSPYEPAMSLSYLVLGEQGQTLPGLGMSYVPRKNTAGKFVFSGGFVWMSRTSTSQFVPRYAQMRQSTVYSDVGSRERTATSIGVGSVGAEYRYDLLRGEIQPYVGIGARVLGGVYGSQWGMAFAPQALAGLNLQISHLFSGFAEVQHVPAVGLSLGGFDSFRGITTIAFGFSFAPQLARW